MPGWFTLVALMVQFGGLTAVWSLMFSLLLPRPPWIVRGPAIGAEKKAYMSTLMVSLPLPALITMGVEVPDTEMVLPLFEVFTVICLMLVSEKLTVFVFESDAPINPPMRVIFSLGSLNVYWFPG